MADAFPDHPFWDFSLKVYLTPGVADACIVLQDRHAIDVNVLLFCCWLGASGRGALTAAEVAATLGAVADWNRDVVCAMRAIRRRLKGGLPPVPVALSDPLRSRIQKIEVDLEHVEQLMLADSVARAADDSIPPDRRAADATANIAGYLAAAGFGFDAQDCRHLAVLLAVAFPDVDAARISALSDGLKAA